jgi:zinc protease
MSENPVRLLGVEERRLPNGLRVIFAPDRAKPTVTVNLTVLVGSIHEGAGEAGMAHIFEHLLFRRLEGFPDVKETLNRMGAQGNGTTWFDRTNFFETMASTKENLETGIRLEAARLGHADLHEEDLEKEGKIVESEFDLRATFPQSLLWSGLLGAMYSFHAYSRDPIGTVEDFRALRIENIRRFYRRHYTPDNAVLFIAGKFDPDEAFGMVERHFGPLTGSGEGRAESATREPAARGERRYVIRAVGEAFHVLVAYLIPGASSPDAAAAQVLSTALSSHKTGPLYDTLVEKGLASSVSAVQMNLRMPSPWFVMAAVPREKDPEAVEKALIETVEGGVASLGQSDVDRAKELLEQDFDQVMNTPDALVGQLSECEAAGSWKLHFVRREQAKTVTLAGIKAFASRYLRRENRVVGRFEPDPSAVAVKPDPEPGMEAYADLLSKVESAGTTVREFLYTPDSLQAALTWLDVGPARIGLISKESKGGDVFIHLRIPHAGRAVTRPTLTAGGVLGAIMAERTRSLGKEKLQSFFAESKSSVGMSVSMEGIGISIEAKRDRLEAVLPVVWEILRTPFFDEHQVRVEIDRQRAKIETLRDNPPALLGLEVNKALFPPGDPRRKLDIERQLEEIAAITPAALMDFHADFFGAEGLRGAVVGDLSPVDVSGLFLPLVADGWKARKPFVEESDRAVDALTAAELTAETPGKPTAFSAVIQPLRLSMTSPDFAPLQIAALALVLDPLASRIPKRLREEEALCYAVQGNLDAKMDGDFSTFLVVTVTSPVNAAKAAVLVREELEKALREGFSDEEMISFKESFKGHLAVTRADDAYLASEVLQLNRAGFDFGLWRKFDEQIDRLTAADVNAALRRHLRPAEMGLVRVGDFAPATV